MDQGKGARRQGEELNGSRAAPGRIVRIGAATVRVDDDQPTFWDRVGRGTWEPGTIAALECLLGPGSAFVDLGAWVGPLSLLAASRGADVLAVEADPGALGQLRRNLAANPDLAGRIDVLERAVSPNGGLVRLGVRRKPGDSMSSVLLAGREAAWEVDAVTPESLADRFGPGRPVVTKLDIEGGEYDLLPAMYPLLACAGSALLVSFHPGLLAEAGDPDPAGRALDAVAALPPLASFAVDEAGVRAQVPTRAALRSGDTWLFRRTA